LIKVFCYEGPTRHQVETTVTELPQSSSSATRTNFTGSRDAIREAFRQGIIDQGEIWMDVIASRNLSGIAERYGTESLYNT
jgi:hypothetical protein